MTEHLKITAKIPRKRYVADGTQTVFSFDFVLFQPSELLVTVNGVPVASGVAVSLLADGTGIATFAAAPAASAVVVLQRRVTIKRETDFQEGGELRAKTLNDEFDFQTAALQQLEAAAARALRLPADDADDAATVLPIAAVRATRMLAFDASGNPTVSNQTLAQIEAGSNAAVTSAADAAARAAAAAASAASVGSLATAAA
ncbi:MAG: phage tail fiber protein, partial [Rhodospirillales bacterium]